MISIVVVGSSNTDMVVQVPHLPAPGETVLGSEFVTAAGGKGANQAVAAARLGAQVTLVACVGDDAFGRQALEGFQGEGLNTDHVRIDPAAASGVALIVVDPAGENSIAVASGANMRLAPPAVAAAREAIEASDLLLAQLEVPLETVLAAAHLAQRCGTRVVLNPAPAPSAPLPDELLRAVDVLTPNEGEALSLAVGASSAQAAARHLIATGVEGVVITLAERGALVVTAEEAQLVPGYAVRAVDTTAAGDAFNGGLAVALAEGKPLTQATRFANACGALATTRLGAQPSLPTAEQVAKFLSG